jgi:hypothetical protein
LSFGNFNFKLSISKNKRKNIKKKGMAGILYRTKLPNIGVTIPIIVIKPREYIMKKYPILLKLVILPNKMQIIIKTKIIIFSIAFGKTARE